MQDQDQEMDSDSDASTVYDSDEGTDLTEIQKKVKSLQMVKFQRHGIVPCVPPGKYPVKMICPHLIQEELVYLIEMKQLDNKDGPSEHVFVSTSPFKLDFPQLVIACYTAAIIIVPDKRTKAKVAELAAEAIAQAAERAKCLAADKEEVEEIDFEMSPIPILDSDVSESEHSNSDSDVETQYFYTNITDKYCKFD